MRHRSTIALFASALLLLGCAGRDGGSGPPSHADLGDGDIAAAARAMAQALETLPDGQNLAWQGEGAGGSFKPFRTYVSAGGHYCRQLTEELRLEGRSSLFQHEACRDKAGRWVWL